MPELPQNDILILEDTPTRRKLCEFVAKQIRARYRTVENFDDFKDALLSVDSRVCLLDGNFPRNKDDSTPYYLGPEALDSMVGGGHMKADHVLIISDDAKMRTYGEQVGCMVMPVHARNPIEFIKQVTIHVEYLLGV